MKKFHVNVGTIGHMFNGKTTLTAALPAVQAARGLATAQELQGHRQGGATSATKNKTVTSIVTAMSGTKPRRAETPTSTVPATPITSRT